MKLNINSSGANKNMWGLHKNNPIICRQTYNLQNYRFTYYFLLKFLLKTLINLLLLLKFKFFNKNLNKERLLGR